LRLVACSNCHAQYDVTNKAESTVTCRCGAAVDARPRPAVDAEIHRCGSCGAVVAKGAGHCDYCGSVIVHVRRNLSLLCPECFARNREDSRFCTACGVAFRPEPLETIAPELPCVECGALMPPRSVGRVSVNECPNCGGLWVPGDRFDALIDRAIEIRRQADAGTITAPSPRVRGGNPVSDRVKYRSCPVCDAFMLRRNYRRTSGVIIDRCHDHGTWLDPDELEQIAGFILSGGLERARRAENTSMKTGSAPGSAGSSARAGTELAKMLVDHDRRRAKRGLVVSFVDFLSEVLS
jgi:Zn-finger nucleic acid-binding protein